MGDFAVEHRNDHSQVTLIPIIDLVSAETLKDALLDAVSGTGDVAVQGAAVERIDTPGLQVLLSASEILRAGNRRLIMVTPSDVLQKAFVDLGFAAELNDWRDE